MNDRAERLGAFYAFLDLLIIAASPVVAKAWQGTASIWAYTSITLVPSALFLWLLRPGQVRKWFRPDVFPLLLANAVIGNVATFLLFFTALKTTTATNASLVEEVEIAYSVVIAVVFLRERIPPRQIVGTLGIVAAAMTVLYHPGFRFNRGELLMLVVPLGFQIGHAIAKRLLTKLDPLEMAAGRQAFATIIIVALAATVGRNGFDGMWRWQTLAALAGIGLVAHAANSLVWFGALSRMGLAKCTAIVMAYPVVTAVIEGTLRHELPPTKTLAALGIMIAAFTLLVTVRSESREAPTPG